MKLSDVKIRALKPSAHKDQWINDGSGLYLRIRRRSKNFVLRRKVAGKTKIVTLGPWRDPRATAPNPRALSLRQARVRALQYSPSTERKREVQSLTVADVTRRYCKLYVHPTHKRPEHFTGYLRRSLLPALGDTRIAEVSTADLSALVEDYAKNRSKRGADALRGAIKQVFGYATEAGFIETDPSANLSRRITQYVYRPRSRVLSVDEIKALWATESRHAPLLRWLLVTGARIGEGQKARWSALEQTPEGSVWRIAETKSGRPHWVLVPPIGDQILAGQDRDNDWIFYRMTTTATQAWLRRWCKREGIDPFTPHDLRRTFATLANEIGIPSRVVSKCLNHSLSGVEATYNRAELEAERMAAAIKWGEWLEGITHEA